MKLTFTKVSTGKKVIKDIAFSSPISKSVNKAKDLFYYIDLNDKCHITGTYKIKCCRLSKIDKKKTDFEIIYTINKY
jgi:hypothetical protein